MKMILISILIALSFPGSLATSISDPAEDTVNFQCWEHGNLICGPPAGTLVGTALAFRWESVVACQDTNDRYPHAYGFPGGWEQCLDDHEWSDNPS